MIQHHYQVSCPDQTRYSSSSEVVDCDAVILTDAIGRILGWNQPAVSCFGWSTASAIGQSFHELVLPERHHSAYKRLLFDINSGGAEAKEYAELMLQGQHRDQYEFPIQIKIFPVETLRGVNFSVFVRHFWRSPRVTDEWSGAAIAFRSQEGILITDSNFRVVDVNESYSRITGFDKLEVQGKKSPIFRSYLHAPGCFQMLMLSLISKRCWQGEVLDRRKSGEYYRVLLRVNAVVDKNNEVSNYVALFAECKDAEKTTEQAPSLAFFDSVTRLPNRQLMLERLSQTQTWTQHECGVMLMLDVDNLKSLNETLGYEIGDLLLMQVAHRLTECLCANDTLARVGGDEFAVMVGGGGDFSGCGAARAREAAERVLRIFDRPFLLSGQKFKASASIGIALSTGPIHEHMTLLSHAETAMVRAQKCGGNCIRFFDFTLQAELEARQSLVGMMREGFPAQFSLNLQVQVDHLGTPFGAEVLLRWRHPEQGAIPPGTFIPLAEESGLIHLIGAWVMESTCQLLARWAHNPIMRHLRLSFNVSAKEFSRSDFSQKVISVLEMTGADASLLEIELTESLMVSDIDDVIAKMLVLKERGVEFSIDDFGTGYSSLSYLKRLPLNRLKIDQSFVNGIADDHHDAAIVRAVIALARSLSIDVIAEGVESDLQYALLEEEGCQHFQGYLFGKPVPVSAFESMLDFQSTSVKANL